MTLRIQMATHITAIATRLVLMLHDVEEGGRRSAPLHGCMYSAQHVHQCAWMCVHVMDFPLISKTGCWNTPACDSMSVVTSPPAASIRSSLALTWGAFMYAIQCIVLST